MSGVNNDKPKDTNQTGSADDKDGTGGGVDLGGDGETIDPGDTLAKTQAANAAMLAAQSTMQLMGMKSQLVTAGLNIAGQAVGATAAMAVQVVTDLTKTAKAAVKDTGEAFQKAN